MSDVAVHTVKSLIIHFSIEHEAEMNVPLPTLIATPYGGRLIWQLPGGNTLVAHLKDKVLIRHRKRWSQVEENFFFSSSLLGGGGGRNSFRQMTFKSGKSIAFAVNKATISIAKLMKRK